MLAHNCLITANVSEGTRCCLTTRGFYVEITDGGPRLVHTREGEGLGTELVPQSRLDVEVDVLDGRD